MKKKKVFAAALLVVVLAATFAPPTFAYENEYAEDGDIQWVFDPDYANGTFTLDNSMNGTTNDLTLFLVTEDAFFINEWDITYRFDGKMSLDEEYPDYGFQVHVGMPLNHTATSSLELGGMPASVRQVQVGIYPGYYNFYNYGENASSSSMSGGRWYVKTLSPNYKLKEEGEGYNRIFDEEAWSYKPIPNDAFVEVQEGENKRVYAIVGEREFIDAAQEDFEDWAVETEAHYVAEGMASGERQEVEVEVPEENLEGLLESAAPEVEVEEEISEPETPVFEEVKEPEPVEQKKSSSFGLVLGFALALAFAICAIAIIRHKSGGKS